MIAPLPNAPQHVWVLLVLGDDHYKRMSRVTACVARLWNLTAQWPGVPNISQNFKSFTGNGYVSKWVKNSRVWCKTPKTNQLLNLFSYYFFLVNLVSLGLVCWMIDYLIQQIRWIYWKKNPVNADKQIFWWGKPFKISHSFLIRLGNGPYKSVHCLLQFMSWWYMYFAKLDHFLDV